MPKLPCCDRCIFCAHSPHLVCAIHPGGIDGASCDDFQHVLPGWTPPDDDPLSFYEPDEQWQPDGATYYNGELILTPEQRLSLEERWHLLDTHPVFTGRCPQCERGLAVKVPDLSWEYDCGWRESAL